MECTAAKNQKGCTCTYSSCTKKGRCCECIQYHKSMDELPGCLFPSEVERTYDRSRNAFIKAYSKK